MVDVSYVVLGLAGCIHVAFSTKDGVARVIDALCLQVASQGLRVAPQLEYIPHSCKHIPRHAQTTNLV